MAYESPSAFEPAFMARLLAAIASLPALRDPRVAPARPRANSGMLTPYMGTDAKSARADDEEERALALRAKAGDRAALGALFKKFGPILYRAVLLPRLGSEASAEDALADTFVKACAAIGRFEWQDRGFYPWLKMIAVHNALDQLRSKKRLVVWDQEDVTRAVDAREEGEILAPNVIEENERAHLRARLEAQLANLHPRYAHVLRERLLVQRSREDVARELDVTPATFDVLFHRAMKALKDALARQPVSTEARLPLDDRPQTADKENSK